MKIDIRHRFNGSTLFTGEVADDCDNPLREAVSRAIASRANLTDADLARADLADANLAGADLADANLAGAYLEGANLEDANLTGADLADANLAGANLAGADLARADLADANLADANLTGADLADANLAGARNVPPLVTADPAAPATPREPYKRATNPRDYAERAARYREHHPEVPFIPALDRKILDRIEAGTGKLNMSTWHTCETTHCRAGWAIALAGEAGAKLERERGPQHAGAMIYRASTGRVPHFFASDKAALDDIREQAALVVEPVAQ